MSHFLREKDSQSHSIAGALAKAPHSLSCTPVPRQTTDHSSGLSRAGATGTGNLRLGPHVLAANPLHALTRSGPARGQNSQGLSGGPSQGCWAPAKAGSGWLAGLLPLSQLPLCPAWGLLYWPQTAQRAASPLFQAVTLVSRHKVQGCQELDLL